VTQVVRAFGAEAIVVPCDLTDAGQCERAAQATVEAYGRIDILVNVAGGSGPIGKTGVETTPEEFDDIVTLNMNGCFHTMRGVLPAMMAQRYGKIVNVGGTFGMRGRAGRMPTRRRNGGCAASPRASRSKPAPTTSTSIASPPAWSTGRAFATRSAPTWPSALASRSSRPSRNMPASTRCGG
jgi:NAD(P)-dependent dehydrogenase (short-subunit alcohol dehydrogenase family)